jgi:hypothetical protein
VDVDAALQINLTSTQAAADAVVLHANNAAGGIQLQVNGNPELSVSALNVSIPTNNLLLPAAILTTATDGYLTVSTTTGLPTGVPANGDGSLVYRTDTDQLYLRANGAWTTVATGPQDLAATLVAGNVTGGTNIDVNGSDDILFSGAALQRIDKTAAAPGQDLQIRLLGANASRIVLDSAGTGVDAINLTASAGGLTLNTLVQPIALLSAAAVANAVTIDASGVGGGVDINALAGGVTVDTTGGISLDSTSVAVPSNFTHVGAAGQDLTVQCTAGSLNLVGGEADASAVRIFASNAAGGIDVDAGTNGINVNSVGGTIGISTNLPNGTGIYAHTTAPAAAGDSSGALYLQTGTALLNGAGAGGASGGVTLQTGNGGATTLALAAGGLGGVFDFLGGSGGAATTGTGGVGSSFGISCGSGGDATAGTSGAGGNVGITAGSAGTATAAAGIGAAGGNVSITSGAGGPATHAGSGNAGNAGTITLLGGTGGTSGGANGGDGGSIALTGGSGGTTGASGTCSGGNITLTAGNGNATDGPAGNITLTPGTPTGAGAPGTVTIAGAAVATAGAHLETSQNSIPTIASGGTFNVPVVSADSTDTAGSFTFDDVGNGAGTVTITFRQAYTHTPFVMVTPITATGGNMVGNPVGVFITPAAGNFILTGTGTTAGATGFAYHVIA